MAYRLPYPRWHKKDVYNPPRWVFMPGVSVGSIRAAKMLRMDRVTFLRYVDHLGLTVYRDSSYKRYFLLTELVKIKERIASLDAEDVRRSRRGGNHELI